ncbi:carbohydrate ABC transporter permease [Marinomonas sp.]|uniref:carbohydrate ABC transporter permease n=1 Tax=Marinomonas sp. TaxID=1904862 RepID=UPI003BAB3035
MSRRRLSTGRKISRAFQYFTLILASIFVLMPLWSAFVASFKTASEYANSTHISLPESFLHFDNYRAALFPEQQTGIGLVGAFANTLEILLFSLAVLILIGAAAGYALERFRFPGRLVIIGLYAMLAVVPQILTPVSTFQILSFLGVVNTRWALVLLYSGADIVSLLVLIQFVRAIPVEIDESARIEGANYFQIFFRLIMPMMLPAISTVIILRTVSIYNDFVAPYLYASKPGDQTVSMILYQMADVISGSSPTVIMATVIIVILPTLIAFFFIQKFIYAGITQGAVKG